MYPLISQIKSRKFRTIFLFKRSPEYQQLHRTYMRNLAANTGEAGGGGGGKALRCCCSPGSWRRQSTSRHSRTSNKPLCWPTTSPSVAGRGTNTLRLHTAVIFGTVAECNGGVPQECKQRCGLDFTRPPKGGGGVGVPVEGAMAAPLLSNACLGAIATHQGEGSASPFVGAIGRMLSCCALSYVWERGVCSGDVVGKAWVVLHGQGCTTRCTTQARLARQPFVWERGGVLRHDYD